jgi:Ni,Fe-hydrogenase I cytochrome b subunit
VRLIAWLEILGAPGLVLGVTGYFIGFQWALWFAVAAAIGLVLTMIGALLVHASRGETKYTLKMHVGLLSPPLVAAVPWAIFPSL